MGVYFNSPVVVGMPIDTDYKADVRIISVLEQWDRTELAETYYASSNRPEDGRDNIVSYAKYRLPSPTHILFIDSDVLPRKNTLDRLLDLDKDIVTGVYPMSSRHGMVWSVANNDIFYKIDDLPTDPFKVQYCGFGVVLVKMEVFDKIEWPYWDVERSPGKIDKGEDVYFCDKAHKAGYDIWCDPKVKCNHIRMANYLSLIR